MRITRAQALGAALAGTLLCFGGNGLVTVAEQEVPVGTGGADHRLGAAVGRDHAPGSRATGRPRHARRRGVGFTGLAVLVLPGDRPEGAPLWGVLLIVLAAILWAAGSFYSKRMTLPEDALVSTAFQMLLGGAER